MPITVAQMAANEKPLTVETYLGTLNLVYFPGKLTLKNITTYDSGVEGMIAVLAEIIKSWDLTATPEDTSMYPINQESLAALGLKLLREVGWAIMGDANPSPN